MMGSHQVVEVGVSETAHFKIFIDLKGVCNVVPPLGNDWPEMIGNSSSILFGQ